MDRCEICNTFGNVPSPQHRLKKNINHTMLSFQTKLSSNIISIMFFAKSACKMQRQWKQEYPRNDDAVARQSVHKEALSALSIVKGFRCKDYCVLRNLVSRTVASDDGPVGPKHVRYISSCSTTACHTYGFYCFVVSIKCNGWNVSENTFVYI
jgi:hypothetical protein